MDFMGELYTVFVRGASWSCRTAGLQARFMIHERAWRSAVPEEHEKRRSGRVSRRRPASIQEGDPGFASEVLRQADALVGRDLNFDEAGGQLAQVGVAAHHARHRERHAHDLAAIGDWIVLE